MFIINIANPFYALVFLIITVLVIILGKEVKKSIIPAILLMAYLALLIMHMAQYLTLQDEYMYLSTVLGKCLTFDFLFILLTFVSYLWIDGIEAKFKNKKSIDNSLDWFWKKV